MLGSIHRRLHLRPSWAGRLPPRTVRLRLTLLYGGLFLISGAVLLTITYLLVRHATGPSLIVRDRTGSGNRLTGGVARLSGSHIPRNLSAQARGIREQALQEHAATLHQLLVQSGIALGIMAIVSVALGWLMAGRVLRPLRTITATTRRISERNLHERLAIDGPRDELRDLADTFDGLLTRLESAFGAQKRFVANAAHELRTPMTLLHALLQENLADPDATIDSFRATSRRLLTLGEEQEQLLESLLTLASSERGLDHRQRFDLSVLVDDVLRSPPPELEHLQLDAHIRPAPTMGDPPLAGRLVANLIDNAVRYNTPGGHVTIATGTNGEHAFLTVANTGPVVAADEVQRLFEPFQRLSAERTSRQDGHHGLGLSIVQAIATAHHATITTRAPADGGLEIQVDFPLATAGDPSDTTHPPPMSADALAEERAATCGPSAPASIASAGSHAMH